MRRWFLLCLILIPAFALSGCDSEDDTTSSTGTYSVSGTVTGLSGTAQVKLNGASSLYIYSNGSFTFGQKLESGDPYVVSVTGPAGQACSVLNATGTIAASVSDVQVICSSSGHTVGGLVNGLSGTVVLLNNGSDMKTVSAAGAFTFAGSLPATAVYNVSVKTNPLGQSCVVVHGNGTMTNTNVTDVVIVCSDISTYTVGGSVSGLTGTAILKNNGGDPVTISADGFYNFPTALNSGSAYTVTVSTQPLGQTCTVSNASGFVLGPVNYVDVACVPKTYTIGGTVTGLSGASLVLQNNGGDDKTVGASGSFTFASQISHGSTYAATVLTQPPGHTCTITHASGTATANVATIAVACTKLSYTVSGTVSGLSGGSLVLKNNGANNLTVAANGAFAFTTKVIQGGAYAVTVSSKPSTQACSVTNGSGTINAADVTNVTVTCADIPTFLVGGTVSGLTGTVVLRLNASSGLSISSDGSYSFATAIRSGSLYSVTIYTQPAGQTCTVAGGTGVMGFADVTNVNVTCVEKTYTVGGAVTGLPAGGTFDIQNELSDDKTIAANGTYTFATALHFGDTYSVTVSTQPTGYTCTVSNASGTVAANVTNANIACTKNSYLIGGTVTGLTGSLVIKNGGSNSTTITGDGPYTFTTPILHGAAYSVSVFTQPSGERCSIANASGTVNGDDVTDADITCAPPAWVHPQAFTDSINPAGVGGAPRVAMDANGNEIIVWMQNDASDNIQLFKSEFRNGTWTHPSSLSDNITPDGSNVAEFDLAMDDNGNAIIVWTQSNGTNDRVYKSERRNGTWTNPSNLSSPFDSTAYDASSPRVAMANNGRAIIVWSQNSATVRKVFKREYVSGSWNAPSSLSTGITLGGYLPRVAMNDTGATVVTFIDGYQTYKAEYRGSWSLPTDSSALSANIGNSGDIGSGFYLDVGIDNAGNAVVAWTTLTGTAETLYFAEYRGGAWTIPTGPMDALSFPASGDQNVTFADLAMSASGDAAIVWSQNWTGGEIFMSEFRAGSWTHPSSEASYFSIATASATAPSVAMNASGDTVLAWQQSDGTEISLFKAEYYGGVWNYPADQSDKISLSGTVFGATPDTAVGTDQAAIVYSHDDSTDYWILSSQYW